MSELEAKLFRPWPGSFVLLLKLGTGVLKTLETRGTLAGNLPTPSDTRSKPLNRSSIPATDVQVRPSGDVDDPIAQSYSEASFSAHPCGAVVGGRDFLNTTEQRGSVEMSGPYAEMYGRSIDDPAGFWGDAAEDIQWDKPWEKVLDGSNEPFFRWFVGGRMNTCYNALDYHVENGRADQAALVYDSPVTNTFKSASWPLMARIWAEPTRLRRISYAVFCLKKKKNQT